MLGWLKIIASACMLPVRRRYARMKSNDNGDGGGDGDGLMWSHDLGRHAGGEYSFAVVQANTSLEDHSQVETGPLGTFVGVYDGHGGPDAATFVREHLFRHLISAFVREIVRNFLPSICTQSLNQDDSFYASNASEVQFCSYWDLPISNDFLSSDIWKTSGVTVIGCLQVYLSGIACDSGTISEDVVRNAFSATEDGFLSHVRRARQINPLISAVGSCCLVGVIWRGTLYVANLGDSRAVVGCLGRSENIIAEQLTRDHNASMEDVRQELRSLHPDDSNVVVMIHGVWRIKGIIQVSRSIGDVYLKRPEFTMDPSYPRFRLSEPLRRPILTAEPSIYTRAIHPHDKFVIFATDGLWEHLTNQQAAEIVYNYPRVGIARRLIRTALHEAARKRKIKYAEMKKVEKGVRRLFHDDITVVVIFIDHELLVGRIADIQDLSVRGFVDAVGPSNFSLLDGIDANV